MPTLNEISIRSVGKQGKHSTYIWSACEICGSERWVLLVYGKPAYYRCRLCAVKEHPLGIHNYHWVFESPRGTIENPVAGDVRDGSEVGKTRYRFQWSICPLCNKGHWTRLLFGKVSTLYCNHCRQKADRSPTWKGGRHLIKGYIMVYITKDNFFWPMALQRVADVKNGRGYVVEHRLVMAQHLKRCLQKWEVVHHKNGIRDDNRIDNLELTTNSAHITDHNKGYKDGYQKGLTDGRLKQIEELKTQNAEMLQEMRFLQLRIKELIPK
jgi:hypothetical protein